MTIAERLIAAREGTHYTAVDAAAHTGIPYNSIYKWEHGKAVPRRRESVKALADLYEVEFEWLMYGEGPMVRPEEKPEDIPQVTVFEEPKPEPVKEDLAPAPAPKKDPTFLVYKAEDGRRLDSINLCIRHIREMNVTQAEKLQMHKALNYFREDIERKILFGE